MHIGPLRWRTNGHGGRCANVGAIAGGQARLNPPKQLGDPQVMQSVPTRTISPLVQRHVRSRQESESVCALLYSRLCRLAATRRQPVRDNGLQWKTIAQESSRETFREISRED